MSSGEQVKKSSGSRVYIAVIVVLIVLLGVAGFYAYSLMGRNSELEKEVSVLRADLSSLQDRYRALNSSYATAIANYESLRAEYTSLADRCSKVESDYRALQTQYSNLLSTYNTLKSNYTALQASFSELEANYTQLKEACAPLQDKYNTLLKQYSELQNSYSKLEANYTQLYGSYTALQTYAKSLNKTIQELQNEYNAVIDWYNKLRNAVNSRSPSDPSEWPQFITPDDPAVQNIVRLIIGATSSYETTTLEINQLYKWVRDNIRYQENAVMPVLPDIGNTTIVWREGFWKYPNETLRDMAGTDIDIANLLASMIYRWSVAYRKADKNALVIIIKYDVGGQTKTHYVTAYATYVSTMSYIGQYLKILDPVLNYTTKDSWVGYSPTPGIPVANAVNEYIKYLQSLGYSNIRFVALYGIYSGNYVYKLFMSNDELIVFINSFRR